MTYNLPRFPQIRKNLREVFPAPADGALVEENPPCLIWLPVEGADSYTVVVEDEGGREIERAKTARTYFVPRALPKSGKYVWNVLTETAERGKQTFTLAEKHVTIHRTTAEALYDAIPDERPRHLFTAADRETLLREKKTEIEVLKRNIEEAYRDGLPEPPMFHRSENALPYREYFGRFRDFVDRNLVALALGYSLLGDEKAGTFGKELLLTVCDRNPNGPCSLMGKWGDEIGLSMARCLPAVFDMLSPLLDEKETDYVARTVRAYGEQCRERLYLLDFCKNPGNSHAGRLPAYLGEAAIALKGTGVLPRAEALEWLDYALEVYGGIFPYFGGTDGGWAEGTFFSTSYTRWYLPFFCLVERYSDCRFLDRPFYQRLTQFFLHFASPDFENHPFGDGYWCRSEDKEWPGFFAQNPCRLYADRFGPEEAKKRAARAAEQTLYRLHLLDIFIPKSTPPAVSLTGEAENVRAFPEVGFAAMHTSLSDVSRDTTVLVRASKYGADSHRHPDQGSFALFDRGTALISPSGYFGRQYGTRHHMEWLNSTRAHNAILIDGEGQRMQDVNGIGKILVCRDDGDKKTTIVDLSPAYPMLKKWVRTLVLAEGLLTVTDEVEADHPVTVTYPLHTLSRPEKGEDGLVTVTRGNSHLRIEPIAGDLTLVGITDRFAVDLNAGEPREYHVTMPTQYHLTYESPKKKSHLIRVAYHVTRD